MDWWQHLNKEQHDGETGTWKPDFQDACCKMIKNKTNHVASSQTESSFKQVTLQSTLSICFRVAQSTLRLRWLIPRNQCGGIKRRFDVTAYKKRQLSFKWEVWRFTLPYSSTLITDACGTVRSSLAARGHWEKTLNVFIHLHHRLLLSE